MLRAAVTAVRGVSFEPGVILFWVSPTGKAEVVYLRPFGCARNRFFVALRQKAMLVMRSIWIYLGLFGQMEMKVMQISSRRREKKTQKQVWSSGNDHTRM